MLVIPKFVVSSENKYLSAVAANSSCCKQKQNIAWSLDVLGFHASLRILTIADLQHLMRFIFLEQDVNETLRFREANRKWRIDLLNLRGHTFVLLSQLCTLSCALPVH